MTQQMSTTQHDAYAAGYDDQVKAYDCHMADVLFGLCYEYLQPGQRLLDLGIGSGLSAELFAKAGLDIYGMDFSLVMLKICQAKGIAADLKLQGLRQAPWPYPAGWFDHLICCGVFHFLADLEVIFDEAQRVLRGGGVFAFTTRYSMSSENHTQKYDRKILDGFEIFSHSPEYVAALLEQYGYERLKTQKCFVREDLFMFWIIQRMPISK